MRIDPQVDAVTEKTLMTKIDIIGFIAAFLTSASFVPQAWLVIKTRNTEGLSLSMYIVFTTGVALWLVYGVMARSWPVAIANAFTLFFALIILGFIINNKKRGR